MVVVGFGMSGKFAQYVALSAPDRVVGQVLIAPSPASKLPFPTEAQRDWVDRVGNREKLREVTAMFITQPGQAGGRRPVGGRRGKGSSGGFG